MKLTTLFAAIALLSAPALAAPASEVEARQIVTFDTLTIALTSEHDGTFLDRTNYGTKTTPRPAPEEGGGRYAFRSYTDPKAFTWKPVGGKQLQVSINLVHGQLTLKSSGDVL